MVSCRDICQNTSPRSNRNRTKNTHQPSNGRPDGLNLARAIALWRRSCGGLAGRRLCGGRLCGGRLPSRGLPRARLSWGSRGGRASDCATGLGARRRRLAGAGGTRRRGSRVSRRARGLRERAVVQIPLAPVPEGVVAGQRVAGGADAVVEGAGGDVEAEGHLLDRETHLGRRARNRAGGALSHGEGDVGQLGVGSPLFDGVLEGVVGQEDLDSGSSSAAAATRGDELLDRGGIRRCARRRSLLWIGFRSVVDNPAEFDYLGYSKQ